MCISTSVFFLLIEHLLLQAFPWLSISYSVSLIFLVRHFVYGYLSICPYLPSNLSSLLVSAFMYVNLSIPAPICHSVPICFPSDILPLFFPPSVILPLFAPICHSVPICPSSVILSLFASYLSSYPYLPPSVILLLFAPLSVIMSVSASLSVILSVFCHPIRICFPICQSVCICPYISSLFVFASLSVSLFLSASLLLSVSVSLSISTYLLVCLYHSDQICLSMSPSTLYLNESLYITFFRLFLLFISFHICVCLHFVNPSIEMPLPIDLTLCSLCFLLSLSISPTATTPSTALPNQ